MHAIVAMLRKYGTGEKLKRFQRVVFSYLPYTAEQLKVHLESQWEPWMNWDNYGKYDSNRLTWQIDHITPQSALPFSSFQEENFQKLWALDNLRPLEVIENIKKGSA
jgi:hypothetical protein